MCGSDIRAMVMLHVPNMQPIEINQDAEGIQKEIQTLTNELDCIKTEEQNHTDGMEEGKT